MHTIRSASTGADWIAASALLHDHVEWMRGWTSFDPLAAQPALTAELDDLADHYNGDDAVMLIAEWKGLAVGTVAVRVHHDGSAELKRMFVRPVARGRGIGDGLVAAAVAAAADRGCHTLWLETVDGAMHAAIELYRRHGFTVASSRPATLTIDGVVVMERAIVPTECCA